LSALLALLDSYADNLTKFHPVSATR
jgi:hypothetical protein